MTPEQQAAHARRAARNQNLTDLTRSPFWDEWTPRLRLAIALSLADLDLDEATAVERAGQLLSDSVTCDAAAVLVMVLLDNPHAGAAGFTLDIARAVVSVSLRRG